MKKWLILTAMALSTTGVFADDMNAEILKQLQALQQQVQEQQQQIQALKQQLDTAGALTEGEVNRLVKAELDAAIEEKVLAQAKDGGPLVTLNKNVENLKITGDARFRYERQERERGDDPEETRNRFRTRLRLGFVWKTDEGWEIGAGLATGGEDATSTNDTWSDNSVFETGDIRLDYAYAKHKLNDWTFTVGQQKNPFVSSFLLWDGDVRPAGATVQYKQGGLFATLGGYNVYHMGRDEANSMLVAGQVGYEMETEEGLSALVAAAYYHFNDPSTDLPGLSVTDDYDFQVGALYGEVGVPAGDVDLSLYGEVWKNFGADGSAGQMSGVDPEDNDLGWVVGLGGKLGRFSAEYAYGHVEADSVYGGLKDSDFGDTAGMTNTDVEGHKLSFGYKLTKNFSLGGTAMFLNEIEGPERDGTLYQLDLVYKF